MALDADDDKYGKRKKKSISKFNIFISVVCVFIVLVYYRSMSESSSLTSSGKITIPSSNPVFRPKETSNDQIGDENKYLLSNPSVIFPKNKVVFIPELDKYVAT